MQPERTLNLKCPDCGELKAKSLSEIKAQKAFQCDCGFYANLTPKDVTVEKKSPKQVKAIPA